MAKPDRSRVAHVRITARMSDEIDALAVKFGRSRSAMIRELIRRGLPEDPEETAADSRRDD